MKPRLSIIIPALNEAAGIADTLRELTPLRARGVEVIVVDGGSEDDTRDLSAPLADRLVKAPRGRARQLNDGAAHASGETLLFLHADTLLPERADTLLLAAVGRGAIWGRFDVRIAGRAKSLRIVAAMMNLRSRLSGIATGDQAIFVRRAWFERIGGFPDQPLMEDIALSQRLRAIARPACLAPRVTTSGRRWESRGVWRTILLMWHLRWRYWRGESPDALAEAYR
ncbi:TIGR04283 family arsenosugar biosynthesis glycosyltransferase [Cupriavidus sp. CP313]